MTPDARRAQFKRALNDAITDFARNPAPIGGGGVAGVHVGSPLEHVTRRHILDYMLTGLGWQLTSRGTDVAEEARLKIDSDETLYIDYLGFNKDSQQPLLIFEAKAYGKPVPTRRTRTRRQAPVSPITEYQEVVRLLLDGIAHWKAGGDVDTSPLLKEWAEWIEQVGTYVNGIAQSAQNNVARAAISDGNWLVIFSNPGMVFSSSEPCDADTVMYFRPGSLIECSNDIYDTLAREFVVNEIPSALHPTELPSYVTEDTVAAVFRAMWLSRPVNDRGPFEALPRIYVRAALVVVRDDGQCLVVVSNDEEELPYRDLRVNLPLHLRQLGNQSSALHEETLRAISLPEISEATEFDAPSSAAIGSPTYIRSTGTARLAKLVREVHSKVDTFVIILGQSTHYLLDGSEYDACSYHNFGSCEAERKAVPVAIYRPTVEPAAFFWDGQQHYCSHIEMSHRRSQVNCHLAPFEQFMCCRTCALQTTCWESEELESMPCLTRQ
ncbi:hypothetical protein [Paraburkholderia sp. 40]|uniref:hypothetical protein n=1 Tax=Paraburkholderia sp. 40 TaxID=2991059 RepID=UPI003D22D9EE